MDILIDNDVVGKLCRYDLQDLAASHLGGYRNVYVLESAAYVLGVKGTRRGKNVLGSQDASDRAKAFLASVGQVSVAPTDQTILSLAGVPQLDTGELILFAEAVNNANSLVITGDKRAIKALSTAPACASMRGNLAGRIKCLEQLIAELIEMQGFKTVCARIRSDAEADGALRACFSSGIQDTAIAGLRSHYHHLSREAPGLLAPPPDIII